MAGMSARFLTRSRLVKLLATVTIIVFLLGGGLAVRNLYASHVRAKAYERMMAAAGTQAHLRLIRGAEAFLSHPPFRGEDSRRRQVIALYTEAFVHWFLARAAPLDTEAHTRIDMYRRLVLETTSQETQP